MKHERLYVTKREILEMTGGMAILELVIKDGSCRNPGYAVEMMSGPSNTQIDHGSKWDL